MSSETIMRLQTGQMAAKNIFISISGLIGAGKTTLAHALGKEMDLKVYEEPVVNNEYLADFYKDMAKYSFPLQIYLLNARFQAQQQIVWEGEGGVNDRSVYEDLVFAGMLKDAGLMEERDFNTYVALFNNMANFMRKPNLIVHLDVSPEEALRRIKMRNRDCETGISIEYLRDLHAAYDKFIKEIGRAIPVLRVTYEKFATPERMAEVIRKEYETMLNIRTVDPSKAEAE